MVVVRTVVVVVVVVVAAAAVVVGGGVRICGCCGRTLALSWEMTMHLITRPTGNMAPTSEMWSQEICWRTGYGDEWQMRGW